MRTCAREHQGLNFKNADARLEGSMIRLWDVSARFPAVNALLWADDRASRK